MRSHARRGTARRLHFCRAAPPAPELPLFVCACVMAMLTTDDMSTDCLSLLNDARRYASGRDPVCGVCHSAVKPNTGCWAPACCCYFHPDGLSEVADQQPDSEWRHCPTCHAPFPADEAAYGLGMSSLKSN